MKNLKDEVAEGTRWRRLVHLAMIVLFVSVTPLRAQAASSTKLASADWSVKASPNLASNPPSMKTLVSFLNAVLESAGQDDPDIGESDSDSEHAEYVCSFAFKDLRRDGSFSLIVGLGVPQRPSCRDITIIDKTPKGFETYGITGAIGAGSAVSDSIKDLNKDGRLEFILDDPIGELTNKCQATRPVVYAWTGNGYAKVSKDFRNFYQHELDSIDKKIAAYGADDPEGDKLCLQAEAAIVGESVGTSPDAGFKEAMALVSSNETARRYFGIDLLGHLGTPEAQQQLETLTKDKNTGIAYYAKAYLPSLSKAPKKASSP
jgi:hypothetical protein